MELRDWVKKERRFVTAVEAAANGVISIGEDEPVLPDGSCEELLFFATGNRCIFAGRFDIFRKWKEEEKWKKVGKIKKNGKKNRKIGKKSKKFKKLQKI